MYFEDLITKTKATVSAKRQKFAWEYRQFGGVKRVSDFLSRKQLTAQFISSLLTIYFCI